MPDRKPLVVLSGPTGVGKSKMGVRLAKRIGGEIISADSMQVYRGMDIGTAKLSRPQMEGVRHYLIDVADPDEDFDVARYQQLAKAACEQIEANGHLPIVVGGSGFYIQALLYDIDFTESEKDDTFRKKWRAYAETHGAEKLHEKLQAADPVSAEAIHPHNVKRVIRALEYYDQTGTRFSDYNLREQKKTSPFNYRYVVLTDDRSILYDRINARVDAMMEQGFLQEAKHLLDQGYDRSLPSMQGLGYRELFAYLNGQGTLPEAVEKIKQNTRHFAKRQLTWFRREKDVIYLDLSSDRDHPDAILEKLVNMVEEM